MKMIYGIMGLLLIQTHVLAFEQPNNGNSWQAKCRELIPKVMEIAFEKDKIKEFDRLYFERVADDIRGKLAQYCGKTDGTIDSFSSEFSFACDTNCQLLQSNVREGAKKACESSCKKTSSKLWTYAKCYNNNPTRSNDCVLGQEVKEQGTTEISDGGNGAKDCPKVTQGQRNSAAKVPSSVGAAAGPVGDRTDPK
ncbi:MAG: hypothetical protein A2381_15480 [Bdellovibrionales bacterium RIFOXYB1_FULL_37_110]|nr:MAG: hypothetical protein A2417_07330 [Bdellovibrionales bacterium RIFOXYC1_FULL_37_79]OFZ57024.1 MAG: hypothetical protein A2381_15480 [Bdellovibrionales bacterium RIFOXYB1_FULL_37_110]OFZ64023.1 MAG: hypothetical protein A2577_16095 [Bdellovibrionales bacterium RIFOXYD1_FULL_36_51]